MSLKRTEIMAKVRRDTALMERTAVRLDCLGHPAPESERAISQRQRAARCEEMRVAIERVRANLAQLERTLDA